MFYRSENSNGMKPLEIEKDACCFFIRKDFVLVPKKDEGGQIRPEHW